MSDRTAASCSVGHGGCGELAATTRHGRKGVYDQTAAIFEPVAGVVKKTLIVTVEVPVIRDGELYAIRSAR